VRADDGSVLAVIEELLARVDKRFDELRPETPLYRGGLGLESLDAAELSATLEDEFGTDPFSAGSELPLTIGDILAFYRVRSSA
jgi:acyl carrier protein